MYAVLYLLIFLWNSFCFIGLAFFSLSNKKLSLANESIKAIRGRALKVFYDEDSMGSVGIVSECLIFSMK